MADTQVEHKQRDGESKRGDRRGRGDHRGAPRGAPRGGARGDHRGGARGGRGFGRGGKIHGDKDNNEESKGPNRRDDRGPRGDKGARGNKRGRAPKDAPKDSFFFKFHYGPWPELEEIEVKLDSVLPEVVPKEQRLPEPLKEEYIKNMTHLDDEIKSMIEKIKNIRQQKDDVYNKVAEESKSKLAEEGVKDEGKSFKELVADRNAIMDKKKVLDAEIKKEKDKIELAQADQTAIKKLTDPKYKTVKAVEARIKEIEKTVQTETVSVKQEKEYYKDICKLQINFVNST